MQETHGNKGPKTPVFLIVDDDHTNRLLLDAIIKNLGYCTLLAENGKEAVARFQEAQPDMIFMDVRMPVMDGYQAAVEIKSLDKSVYTPIIFITSVTDDLMLSKCIECGGDDFLIKPFNKVLLQAKIDAHMRLSNLYNKLKSQQETLENLNDRLAHEQYIAELIFKNVITRKSTPANIRYYTKPYSIASGDIFLFSDTSDGRHLCLLGDFTGHGLAAAISAVPTNDIFYACCQKGVNSSEILKTINNKLHRILPAGFYCAICLLEIDLIRKKVSIWNGGIPDVIIKHFSSGSIRRYSSSHLPLGIMELPDNEFILDNIEALPGDCIYIFSDGVTEAIDSKNCMLGREPIENLIQSAPPGTSSINKIDEMITLHCGSVSQNDDLTFAEIVCHYDHNENLSVVDSDFLGRKWEFSCCLNADYIKARNPVESVLDMLTGANSLSAQDKHEVRLILTELYINAIDHGLLGMDSEIKSLSNGFETYYQNRDDKLMALVEGQISIKIEYYHDIQGRKLIIEMADSGPGFNQGKYDDITVVPINKFYNRGLALIARISSNIEFNEIGNIVRVSYSPGDDNVKEENVYYRS